MYYLKLCFTIFSLLLITVAISNAENAKATTVVAAPKNDATSKTAPAKEIAMAKSINGKEDETKNVKKGDLGKEKIDNVKSSSEESPSEDAQEDLGVNENNHGPTIPAYQIPEQPKDVKKKKRWVGEPNIDFAIDNALGALFGRPQPADTVIEEVTYVDEYPPGPVVYKRSKGLPAVAASDAEKDKAVEKNLKPSKELVNSAINDDDAVDTVSIKGEPIAVSKPEVEASKGAIVTLKNEQKGNLKMEVGNEVTILPSIDEEKDFASSAENPEEMKYQRIAPEVAGLIKKSIPNSGEVKVKDNASAEEEKEDAPPVEESKDDEKEELQEKEMKAISDEKIEKKADEKDVGQKEFVPVYVEEDEKSEASKNPQKDDPKAAEMEKGEDSEAQKEDSKAKTDEASNIEEANDKAEDEKVNDDASETSNEKTKEEKPEVIPKKTQKHRDPEELPINPKEDDDEENDKDKDSEEEEKDAEEEREELRIAAHEPKKLPEEDNNKSEENKNEDKGAENLEKDEYAPTDDKIEEDKAKIDAINPISPEIKAKDDNKKSAKVEKDDDEKLGPAAYPTSKKDQNPDYIVVEELKDPIQGHRKYTILKPTYREFHPKENHLIEEVKKTLDQSKIVKKRSITASFEEKRESNSEEKESSFENSVSRDTVVAGDSNEDILKNVADALEREDNLRRLKTDQQPMFVPEFDPIPLKKPSGKPSLNEILGIPESSGPIMIEPEGGIPKGLKQVYSNENEYRSSEEYDAPQKVVIQSKQKITLIYDDSSEESTKDSSSSESSEEKEIKKSQPWIPIMDIAVINDQTTKSKQPIVKKIEDNDNDQQPASALSQKDSTSINEGSSHEEEKLKQYSNILGNNLVLTLSISPPILIIFGVICLTLLLFKIYWILYSPPQTSIIPQHSAATTPNTDYRIPLSIVTGEPKKQPI
uniref:Uncharacterized protein n=1 Tax=Panagrolaimus sp. ES5 TaxID=591445 RepID=A0AC34GY75_9BILA